MLALILAFTTCAVKPEVLPTRGMDDAGASPRTLLEDVGYSGEVLISFADGKTRRETTKAVEEGAAWPWASVTKQVIATLILQEIDAGQLDLDGSVGAILPELDTVELTVRQLLQHRSGLRNPEDHDPERFYVDTGIDTLDFCLAEPGDLVRFDRALLADAHISNSSRQLAWTGDPSLGFMGLEQWSFQAPLDGCRETERIIERRGAIGTYQIRNFILPERSLVITTATNRGEGDFDFGEIWTGQGFSYALLSLVACGN